MNAPLKTASNKIGRVTQIMGAVIDVQFDGPRQQRQPPDP